MKEAFNWYVILSSSDDTVAQLEVEFLLLRYSHLSTRYSAPISLINPWKSVFETHFGQKERGLLTLKSSIRKERRNTVIDIRDKSQCWSLNVYWTLTHQREIVRNSPHMLIDDYFRRLPEIQPTRVTVLGRLMTLTEAYDQKKLITLAEQPQVGL